MDTPTSHTQPLFCFPTEEEARLSAREGNRVWQGYERASELLEAALDAPYVGQPLHWLYRSLEGLGRRVRWLVKGGVTVRRVWWSEVEWSGVRIPPLHLH